MSYARPMLDTYPGTFGADAAVLATAIDALSDCAQACTADVDADLSEQNLAEMVRCMRLPGLRRCLHRHARGDKPPGGRRRRRHQTAAAGLHGHLHPAAATTASGMPSTTSTAGSVVGLALSQHRPMTRRR